MQLDKKLQEKNQQSQEKDKDGEMTDQTGQSMTQKDKKDPKEQQFFEYRDLGHISPNFLCPDILREEWWVNKESNALTHQKATSNKKADKLFKKRAEVEKKNQLRDTDQKQVTWSRI